MMPESKFTIKAIRSYIIGGVGSGMPSSRAAALGPS